jgi:shikimate kinase
MTTNIFMLGMPSSGKSTLGRQLAKELNYDFIDLDKKIEVSEGKKINEIFNLEGEDYFRKVESEHLKKIDPDGRVIIATGGGTPCFNNNMEFIKNCGISIFLDVKPVKLEERMRNSKKNTRPLFNLESDSLSDSLLKTYDSRIGFYNQADIVIEGDTDANTIMWILDAHFKK